MPCAASTRDAKAFLRPLTGCRALACLAVVFLHVGLFFAVGGSIWNWYKFLQQSYWPNVVCGASLFFALKVFFLLTGILAASTLVPRLERDHQSWQVIKSYYVDRFWRIAPNYYMLLLMHVSMVMWLKTGPKPQNNEAKQVALYMLDGNIRDTWAYVCLAANLAKAYKLVQQAWSISVQAQWYLSFPLALWALSPRQPHFRQRVGYACLVCMAMSTAYQAWVVSVFEIGLPLPWAGFNFGDSSGHKPKDVTMAWNYFSWVYGSFAGRLADFAMGVLVWVVAASPAAAHKICSRPRTCTLASAASLLGSTLICLNGGVAAYPSADPSIPASTRYVVLIVIMAIWIPLTTAWLLLYVLLQPDRPSRQAASFLSSSIWTFIADKSYSAYCLHWEVLFWIFWLVPVTSTIGPLTSLATYSVVWVLTTVCTFTLAWLQDALLARVVRILRAQKHVQQPHGKTM